jgi:general secretion pathway protein I
MRGFSLLEVLVAFAVLAMVLGALYPIFSATAQQAVLAQDYTRAVSLAESKLADIELLAPGVQSGESDARFHWLRTVERLAQQDAPRAAYRIRVEVRWEHRRAPRSVSLSTIRLGAPA